MKKLSIILIILAMMPFAQAQEKVKSSRFSVGINPIQLYRNGQTFGALFKYYSQDLSKALRFRPTLGFSSNNTYTNTIGELTLPDSLAKSSNKNNNASINIGFEKTFLRQKRISLYSIIELGFTQNRYKNETITPNFYPDRNNPKDGFLNIRKRLTDNKSYAFNAVAGIGFKYQFWKRLSLSLETSISGGPTFSEYINGGNSTQTYQVVNNELTLTNSTITADTERTTRGFSANLNPITNIYLAFRF